MAGAPAGPALDPERPADRLDAVRETDESRPGRRARRAQPPAGSARPPGVSALRPGCSSETLGSKLRATAWRGRLSFDRRLAVLAEDNERCWSSRAALACLVARRSMFGGSPRRIVLPDAGRAPRRLRRRITPQAGPRARMASGLAQASALARARRVAVRPDPAAVVLLGRAQGPSARPLGRSRIVVEGSRGAVNLSSCSRLSSSRTYVGVATVDHFDASALTRTGTSR
jgi:hypothetical protein